MEVYVGGCGQGKLQYVLEKRKVTRKDIVDGADLSPDQTEGFKVINHFHLFIRQWVDDPQIVYRYLDTLSEKNAGVILICDQVGGGVIPIEKKERDWRELVGRVMCIAVKQSDHVERIVCGLGQVLKG